MDWNARFQRAVYEHVSLVAALQVAPGLSIEDCGLLNAAIFFLSHSCSVPEPDEWSTIGDVISDASRRQHSITLWNHHFGVRVKHDGARRLSTYLPRLTRLEDWQIDQHRWAILMASLTNETVDGYGALCHPFSSPPYNPTMTIGQVYDLAQRHAQWPDASSLHI